MVSTIRVVLTIFGAALCLAASVHAQDGKRLYRYVDANGRVYYTDRPPLDAGGRTIDHLSKGGNLVGRTEPGPSLEEIAAREEAKKRREEEHRAALVEHRRNLALITTYPQEKDIDEARAYSLKSHEAVIQETQQRIAEQMQRRDKARSSIDSLTAQKKGASPQLEQELRTAEIEIKALNELLESKRRDVNLINARFDEDKRRWADIARSKSPMPVPDRKR